MDIGAEKLKHFDRQIHPLVMLNPLNQINHSSEPSLQAWLFGIGSRCSQMNWYSRPRSIGWSRDNCISDLGLTLRDRQSFASSDDVYCTVQEQQLRKAWSGWYCPTGILKTLSRWTKLP